MSRRAILAGGAALLVVVVAIVAVVATRGGGPTTTTAATGSAMPGMEMGGEATTAAFKLPPTAVAGPTQIGGLVMPPGMIMTRDMDMQAMQSMAAVDLSKAAYTAPAADRGDQPLTPRLQGEAKVFILTASLIKWTIQPGTQVGAYAFNRQVPGPRIRVTQGDRVRIVVNNDLPEPTSVHRHGPAVPNRMDGAGDVTQPPIPPGGSDTYEFTVQQAGTFFYHSHQQADRQQSLGMYGALIVDPKSGSPQPAYDKEAIVQLREWTVEDGYTFPSMPQEGVLPSFFTINGKAFQATQPVQLKQGQRLLLPFIGSSAGFAHPMHLHGGPFQVVATDGNPVPAAARPTKDTVNVAPRERYDVVWTARPRASGCCTATSCTTPPTTTVICRAVAA